MTRERDSDTKNTTEIPIVFVFAGGGRDWRPLKGHEAPTGMIWEMRAIPGNIVAVASSREAVIAKLERHVERSMSAATSVESWYMDAWEHASECDRAEFGAVLTRAIQRRQRARVPTQNPDNVRFFVAECEALQPT